MKILFIAEPSSTHTQKWLRFFGEAGHQIYLISYYNRYETTIKNVSELAYFAPISKNPIIFLKYLLKLREIIGKIRPDLLTCHYALGTPGLLVALSGFHPQIITVLGGVDLYGNRPNKLRYFLSNKLVMNLIFKICDMIIVGCKDHERYLVEKNFPREKITVIPGDVGLGIDLKVFNDKYDIEKAKEDLNLTGKYVIFCPRRIVSYTNIDLLIGCMPLIKKNIPNAVLLLHTYAVNIKYLDYIKKLIGKYGIGEDVVFSEVRPYEAMPRLYCASDCTISISSFDGTPLTLAESMACGTPVIAYDIPSIREWIKNGENGILIDKLEPEEIIKAILVIYTDREKTQKITVNAAVFVKENLDIEKNKKILVNLYQQIYEKYRNCHLRP